MVALGIYIFFYFFISESLYWHNQCHTVRRQPPSHQPLILFYLFIHYTYYLFTSFYDDHSTRWWKTMINDDDIVPWYDADASRDLGSTCFFRFFFLHCTNDYLQLNRNGLRYDDGCPLEGFLLFRPWQCLQGVRLFASKPDEFQFRCIVFVYMIVVLLLLLFI